MNDRTIPPVSTPMSRSWRRGDRSKISVMHVFRSAYYEHDAKKENERAEDGSAQISRRSKQRRHGVGEDTLKAHLQADLNALMNTIRLDAVVDLEDAPYVARSVANYGFQDLSNISESELNDTRMVNSIRQTLLDHEPRLIPESVEVRVADRTEDVQQRLSLMISAELMGDPVDIPIDFSAEVDLGAGKMQMSGLRVQN